MNPEGRRSDWDAESRRDNAEYRPDEAFVSSVASDSRSGDRCPFGDFFGHSSGSRTDVCIFHYRGTEKNVGGGFLRFAMGERLWDDRGGRALRPGQRGAWNKRFFRAAAPAGDAPGRFGACGSRTRSSTFLEVTPLSDLLGLPEPPAHSEAQKPAANVLLRSSVVEDNGFQRIFIDRRVRAGRGAPMKMESSSSEDTTL